MHIHSHDRSTVGCYEAVGKLSWLSLVDDEMNAHSELPRYMEKQSVDGNYFLLVMITSYRKWTMSGGVLLTG